MRASEAEVRCRASFSLPTSMSQYLHAARAWTSPMTSSFYLLSTFSTGNGLMTTISEADRATPPRALVRAPPSAAHHVPRIGSQPPCAQISLTIAP